MKKQIKKLLERYLGIWHRIQIFDAIPLALDAFPEADVEDIVEVYAEIDLDYDAMLQEAVDGRR